MRSYGDRILQVEKGSFVPLVYAGTGGMGPNVPEHTERLLNWCLTGRMRYMRTSLHVTTFEQDYSLLS